MSVGNSLFTVILLSLQGISCKILFYCDSFNFYTVPTVPNDAHIQQGSSGQIDVLLEPSPGELLIKCITKTNKAPISTD